MKSRLTGLSRICKGRRCSNDRTCAIVNEEGDLEKEDVAYERPDFWTTTKNKQLNFLQHVKICWR
jgi:hypothetical protein